jgi:protein O-GlcNAc transferase
MVTFKYKGDTVKLWSKYDSDHIYKIIRDNKTFYELGLLEKISKMSLGGVYLDVGANIGNHTIFFSMFCSAEQVYSFEIFDEFCDIIDKNIKLNNISNVVLSRFGLGHANCSVTLSEINDNNVGMLSIDGIGGGYNIKTLDDVFGLSDNKITLIKIDVEGFETNVIKGGLETIKKNKPIIITECRTESEFFEQKTIFDTINYKTDKVNHAKTPTYIWEHKNLII